MSQIQASSRRGRVAVYIGALWMMLLTAQAGVATPPDPAARVLVIVLDAIPYETVLEWTRPSDGKPPLFEGLRGPVPMISTFPSSTSVALTAILGGFGLEKPPGYEAKFFDIEAGKIRGGGLVSYRKINFDWHHFFNYQLQGFFGKSRAYAKPRKWGITEVNRGTDGFMNTDVQHFFIYINSTDALGHIAGPDELHATLVNLDKRLQEVRDASPVPVHVVLISDHGQDGGFILPNVRPAVSDAIRDGGWRNSSKLKKPDDVVLTPFGLVSSFEIYTHPDIRAAVAETVAREQGVSVCAHPEDDGWVIVNGEGRAIARRRSNGDTGTTEWSYRTGTADPLRYAPVVARMREETGVTEWFSQSAWFQQTWNEEYPDALYRIAGGFAGVLNPASILCSVAPGHLFGSKSAYVGARFSVGRVKWTHGALDRSATHGFMMTDFPGWEPPPAVRYDEALDFVVEHLAQQQVARPVRH
jgi:hypothetical protein